MGALAAAIGTVATAAGESRPKGIGPGYQARAMDDVDSEAVPGALVEAYLERERGVRELLDELEALAVRGEHAAVRERIRAFAEGDRAAFFAVALALTNSAHFFGDVEAQLGVGHADALRDLAETYPTLAEPFGIVRMEVASDRRNPVTGLDVTTTYDADQEVPLVAYTAHSGDVTLFESRGSPQEVLATATYVVQATNDALEAAMAGDHAVNTDELGELIDRREELESELGVLRDRIDELRRSPAGDE